MSRQKSEDNLAAVENDLDKSTTTVGELTRKVRSIIEVSTHDLTNVYRSKNCK